MWTGAEKGRLATQESSIEPIDGRKHVARAVIPLYRELATNPFFTRVFAKAINRNDKRALRLMVKGLVKTRGLRSVKPDGNGEIILSFKYSFSRYTYQNELFIDTYV